MRILTRWVLRNKKLFTYSISYFLRKTRFDTLRFNQRVPWKRNAVVLYVRIIRCAENAQVSLTTIAVLDFCKDFLSLNGY